MAKKSTVRTREQIIADIDERFQRWDEIYHHGCSDPFWPDGININLVRNHIIYHRKELDSLLANQEGAQISLFASEPSEELSLRPIPPKMPDDWMCPTGRHPNRLFNR